MDVKQEVEELMKAYYEVLQAHVRELENINMESANYETDFLSDLHTTFAGLTLESITPQEVPSQKRKGSKEPVHPPEKKKRKGMIPREAVILMKDWLLAHKEDPYPSQEEKQYIVEKTGLTLKQVDWWFINARRRILKPLLSATAHLDGTNTPRC